MTIREQIFGAVAGLAASASVAAADVDQNPQIQATGQPQEYIVNVPAGDNQYCRIETEFRGALNRQGHVSIRGQVLPQNQQDFAQACCFHDNDYDFSVANYIMSLSSDDARWCDRGSNGRDHSGPSDPGSSDPETDGLGGCGPMGC